MLDMLGLGIGLLVVACVLCTILRVREARRAGDRRLSLLGKQGRLQAMDIVIFMVALICATASAMQLRQSGVPFAVCIAAYLIGLAVPFMVTTSLHNRRVGRRDL